MLLRARPLPGGLSCRSTTRPRASRDGRTTSKALSRRARALPALALRPRHNTSACGGEAARRKSGMGVLCGEAGRSGPVLVMSRLRRRLCGGWLSCSHVCHGVFCCGWLAGRWACVRACVRWYACVCVGVWHARARCLCAVRSGLHCARVRACACDWTSSGALRGTQHVGSSYWLARCACCSWRLTAHGVTCAGTEEGEEEQGLQH